MTPERPRRGIEVDQQSDDHLGVTGSELTPRTWVRATATLVAVVVAFGALLLWALFDSTIPKGTSIPLALLGLLPIAFFLYLAIGVAYFGLTGRKIQGAERLNALAAKATRPL